MNPLFALWRQINAIRLPLFMAGLAAYLLAMPDQTREIYRAIAQHVGTTAGRADAYREVANGAVSILFLCLVIWLIARRNAAQFHQSLRDQSMAHPPPFLHWAPRIIALSPLLGIGFGIAQARVGSIDVAKLTHVLQDVFFNQWLHEGFSSGAATRTAKVDADLLIAFNDNLLVASVAFLVAAIILFLLFLAIDRPPLTTFLSRPTTWQKPWIFGTMALIYILFVAWLLQSPVAAPQKIGAIALVCIFLFWLNLGLLQLEVWGKKLALPLITFSVILSILLAALDINDNHWVRTITTDNQPLPPQTDAPQAFKTWWDTRHDKDRFEQRKFPIYVVAAEGGGIYAAAHAASFLAEIQDVCPAFSHHLFAISGVSGGSVGASVFAALNTDFDWTKVEPSARYGCILQLDQPHRTYFADAVNAIFLRDLWSPLSAGMLFPDFIQRLIPLEVPAFDRARFLEYALEEAYQAGVLESNFLPGGDGPPNTLAALFVHHWDPTRLHHTPALILNTTEVDSGERSLIAPFIFKGIGLRFLPIWRQEPTTGDHTETIYLPTSAAAILSARFPWITPAGSIREWESRSQKSSKLRLVDGGYFENSGAATAVDVINAVIGTAKELGIEEKIEINLLIFTSIDFALPKRNYSFSEFLEPVRAMLNARSARAESEIEKAFAILENLPRTNNVSARVIKLSLEGYGYPLPLGWRLSDITRHIITYQSGALSAPKSCAAEEQTTTMLPECAKFVIHGQLR